MRFPRPLVSLLAVLLAYAVAGHFECRSAEACQAPSVTHNEVFQ